MVLGFSGIISEKNRKKTIIFADHHPIRESGWWARWWSYASIALTS